MSKFWDIVLVVIGIIFVVFGFIAYSKVANSPMPFIEKISLFGIFGFIGAVCAAIGLANYTENPNNSFGSH